MDENVTESIVVTPESVDKIVAEYRKQKAAAAQITVKLSGINSIDVLFLLKVMGKEEPEMAEFAEACEIALDGKTIEFYQGETRLAGYSYNRSGGRLHLMFMDAPYLYDILQQTIYALLLKKLTPRLGSSN